MTKADIYEQVFEKLACTKKEASDLVELTLETLKDAIVRKGFVKISRFGNFVVKNKAARRGRNPQSGEKITITPRKILTFKPSQLLKAHINKEG